jgi:hypothetical protein
MASVMWLYRRRKKGAGDGVFNCDDGRSGPITFASTGTSGTGYGTLGNERFTFTFGS